MIEQKLPDSPIFYYLNDSGCDDWVVFLHSAFVNHKMFNKQFEYYAGKYNILAIDILGHGKSINAKKGDDILKMAFWINEIFEKNNILQAHFVGVSLGSVFVQDFANRYPNKVKSMACFGGYNINNFDMEKQKANSKEQMKLVFKGMFSIKAFAEANKSISAYTKEAQEEFYKINLDFKKKSFLYLAKLQKLINIFPQQKRNYPLLIGCGEFDIPMEKEIVKEWAEKEICEVAIIAGAGHCANMDKPVEFNEVLEKFWLKK